MKKIGLDFNPKGCPMGDLVSFSSLPENYYLSTGNKIVDLWNLWIYDYNPFVLRNEDCDDILDLNLKLSQQHKKCDVRFPVSSIWIYCKALDIKCFVRHPKLYKFENIIPDNNSLCIHTTPRGRDKTRLGPIDNHIIEHILKEYKNYKIYQVGGKDDIKIKSDNCIDMTGLGWWETAEIISKSKTFIATNTGHIQLANCFPKTHKKLILSDGDYLESFVPVSRERGGDWVDFNWCYYNPTEYDRGITMSYLKI